jgi:ATP-dependent Lhr-like helicase
VARYLNSKTVRPILVQAMLTRDVGARWRWIAGTSLALPRFRGWAAPFLMPICGDPGGFLTRSVPRTWSELKSLDHLSWQAVHDCPARGDGRRLALLADIESGKVTVVARD